MIYRFSAIPPSYFVDINKLILKFIQRGKRSRIANTILKEKNKVGRLIVPDLKTYFKITVIKTMWYWQNNMQIDYWKRIESPEIDPHKYSQLIFDKGAKVMEQK